MRKSAPILLIATLLFNVFGYYGLFLGLRFKNTQDVIKSLDAEAYNKEETLLLKMPMAIPYHIDQDDYERVDGEIEYEGEFYRLVKQKLQNDTLYVVCLADKSSKAINKSLADYVKSFADKHNDAKHGKSFQNFIKDYINNSMSIEACSFGWHYDLKTFFLIEHYQGDALGSLTQPPEA